MPHHGGPDAQPTPLGLPPSGRACQGDCMSGWLLSFWNPLILEYLISSHQPHFCSGLEHQLGSMLSHLGIMYGVITCCHALPSLVIETGWHRGSPIVWPALHGSLWQNRMPTHEVNPLQHRVVGFHILGGKNSHGFGLCAISLNALTPKVACKF